MGRRRDDGSLIYFARPFGGGLIKIGLTDDPDQRLWLLQRSSPVRLEIIATTAGTLVSERAIQARFAPHRLYGEWFSPAPEIMGFIGTCDPYISRDTRVNLRPGRPRG